MSKKENSFSPFPPTEIEDEEVIEGQIELVTNSTETALIITKQLSDASASADISEDIRVLDERWSKYLRFQKKIKAIIRSNDKNKDAIVEDIVEAAIQIGKSPSYFNLVTSPLFFFKRRSKRKKLKKIIENILEKVFDASLGYTVDYQDLKMTCNYIGGKDYFDTQDHRAIYEAIIQKLRQGPLREECIKNKLVTYIDEKLIDIYNNYFEFKRMYT